MSNQPSFLTSCIGAVNILREDVKNGQIAFYEIDQLPSGTLPASLAAKCTSAVVAVSGSGTNDYLAILPLRVDQYPSDSSKVVDADPIIFAAKSGMPDSFPTGVFVHHSDYPGRTTPIIGYETSSYSDTVAALRQALVTGIQPLSASNPVYLTAISHGIAHFDKLLGEAFEKWPPGSEGGDRPEV